MSNVFNTLRQSARILSHKDYAKNPKTLPLDTEALRALSVGLINSEQLTAYTDSLTTGLPRGRVLQGLTEAWEIYDEASARKTIAYLQMGGHRIPFNAVLPFIGIEDEDERNRQIWEMLCDNVSHILFYATEEDVNSTEEDHIQNMAEEAFFRMAGFARNLRACIKNRGHNPFCPFNQHK